MNSILAGYLENAGSIVILGHVHPDGDCFGSTLGFYRYLRESFPEKEVRVFLEEGDPKFSYLSGWDDIQHIPDRSLKADLAVALDVSDLQRLGDFEVLFRNAAHTLNIDHHVTNPHFAEETVCLPDASSACEVLYDLLDPDKISREAAVCLYTGLVTDSGVFKYESTSENTMRIAGALMNKGIPFGEIIDRAFYRKSPVQSRILGWALQNAVSYLDGKCLIATITMAVKKQFGADHRDLDGIAEQLRLTDGVVLSGLISETVTGQWKLSLRSSEEIDAARICALYGGGGHVRAAGATINDKPSRIEERVVSECQRQLSEAGEAC